MSSALAIRDCLEEDIPAITEIYAYAVRNNSGTFEIEPPSIIEMIQRREKVLKNGFPYLVAEIDGEVVGYTYANYYHTRAAYRFTIEDSVYVDKDHRGKGIGTNLLNALINQCETGGSRLMVAIIGDAKNESSIAMHRACGFTMIGKLPNAGWKFDKWLDINFMVRPLGRGADTPPE